MDNLIDVGIPVGGFFLLMGFLAKVIAGVVIRWRISGRDLSAEQMEVILRRRSSPGELMKWGLLALTTGAGFVVVQFLPPVMRDGPMAVGLLLIAGGIGLFLYAGMIQARSGD